MSLSLALNNALAGLNVSQRALATVSQNIANANTAGYSRQVVEQSSVYTDGVGSGVKIENVSRKVDSYLSRTLLTQGSNLAKVNTLTSYNDRIQTQLGSPGDSNSLDEYVSNFFDSVQSLAENPERTSYRENAVDSADVLAQHVSDLASGMHDLRYQADQDIKNGVRSVNAALSTINKLNLAISQAKVLGQSTAGLEDQMDVALNTVASYLDIQTTKQDTGAVFVYAVSGPTLVDDSLHQLRYIAAPGLKTFEEDQPLNALTVVRINHDGKDGEPETLITGSLPNGVSTSLRSGSLSALQELRDKQIPDILAQLDNLAAGIRDTFNAIHNDGSSFPGTQSLTGTRTTSSQARSEWSGSVTIAVLGPDGKPVASPYKDESHTGIRPLNLDLTKLESGFGQGQPTTQTIIDEINNHFAPPPVKAEIGNLNNVQLVSDTNSMPDAPPSFTFDFDLDNLDRDGSQFFVGNVTVRDENGIDITSITRTTPSITINSGANYATSTTEPEVTILADNHGLKDGDYVYLTPPGAPVDGIPAAQLGGYFRVHNVTANGFTIDTIATGAAGGLQTVTGTTATPPYGNVGAGEQTRVRDQGKITADLSGNAASAFYDITVSVGVGDLGKQGVSADGTITYRIYNNQTNLLNDRYSATAVSGDAKRVAGETSQPSLVAKLVDESGVELPKVNGVYVDKPGFLKLEAFGTGNTVALDEGNSSQLGLKSTSPQVPGTGRGFSHYFELNNFFQSNEPTTTGDTVKGSALGLKVEQRILNNSNLISLGTLTKSTSPVDLSKPALYTVERSNADNSVIQRLAAAGNKAVDFAAAGGLDSSSTSFVSYTGEILGLVASKAASADAAARDTQTVYDGFKSRLDAVTGVNIDEELANTIIYQHAYTASARIISTTDQLFDTLLNLGN